MTVKNLDAHELARLMKQNAILLVDVREPREFASGHIPGAVLFPLSAFNVRSLPDPKGRAIVFQCASGMRSASAVALCQRAGLSHDSHLKGGIQAWKTAGLPVER
jgi:rhodanese-related sulfurtransferase